MNSKLLFLSNFLKKPKEIASVAPSSKHVIRHIIQNINFANTKCIVEYGPGVGNITNALLKLLKPDAKLICFETNRKFCSFLKGNIKDSRLEVINDTAKNLDFYLKKYGISNLDYAVSGIPFSLMNKEDKKTIIQNTRDRLRKGGKFIVYQNSQHMKKYLSIHFKKMSVDLEVRNIPPTFIFVCEKI